MRKGGFTLIELLVVIAIIAVLAMLLFPVFVRVMDNAKTAKCVAHGHELSKACFLYMDEWDGRFPRPLNDAEVAQLGLESPGPYDWPGTPHIVETYWPAGMSQLRQYQLKPYVKNKDIWICPSPKGFYTRRYAYGYQCSWLPRWNDDFVDGDLGFVEPAKTPNGQPCGRTIPEVVALELKNRNKCGPRYLPPSKKIMFMCYAFGEYGDTLINNGKDWVEDMFPDYPHGDGSVFVFADGHAKRLRMGMGWAPVGYTKVWMDRDPGL